MSLYRPLDGSIGEIRLLTVKLPAKDEESGPDLPLEVELSYTPLAEASYDALSYTWGEKEDGMKPIHVNGIEIQIGINLFKFLQVYREYLLDRRDERPSKTDDDLTLVSELTEGNPSLTVLGLMHIMQEKESQQTQRENNPAAWQRNIPLWIDAICIDQNNVPEKNEQIPRMRDIYSKADAVIVWLGEADESSELATRYLRKMIMKRGIDMMKMILPFARDEENSTRQSTVDGLQLEQMNIGGTKQDEWDDVAKLFDRPYWKRMWVIQELVCGNYAQLWCGYRILGVAAVKRVQRDHWGDELADLGVRAYLDPRYGKPSSSGAPVSDSLVLGGTWPLEAIKQLIKTTSEQSGARAGSVRAVMSLMRLRKATEPKDMVYSLIGILPPCQDYSIPVDYAETYSTAQAYCDFMRYEILRSKSLDIWQLLTEEESKVEGLPSWAVDWVGQNAAHEHIKMKTYVDAPETREDLLERSHATVCAAGDTTASVRFLDPHSTIAVSGFVIGGIDGIGSKSVKKPDDDAEGFYEDFGQLNGLMEDLGIEVTLLTCIQIGCCLRLDSYGTLIERKDNQIMQKDVDAFKTVAAAGPNLSLPHASLLVANLQLLRQAGFDTGKPNLITPSIKRKFWDRRWISNTKFRTFGSAPARSEKGDILFVPRGCPFVVVLHPVNESSHAVVGTCWLNGFMHGEAVKLWEEGIIEEKEFVLR